MNKLIVILCSFYYRTKNGSLYSFPSFNIIIHNKKSCVYFPEHFYVHVYYKFYIKMKVPAN